VMVQHLSDIFRYNLSKGNAVVPFSEELEHIKKYLFIQEFRFKDRFEVQYDIDEQIIHCSILRLTLQPLVENALHHGLEPKREKGEIKITAKAYDDSFYIYIHDNGLGIPHEKLDQINASLDNDAEILNEQSYGNVGIYNVNARIKYHFGNGYGLKIISTTNVNTTVKIVLPIQSII
jgi:two-component system sensor histidine kinase YesM